MREVFDNYCENPYKFGERDCIQLVDSLLESKGYEPTDSAKYRDTGYLRARINVQKDYGSMLACYEDILGKHPNMKEVTGPFRPYDIVILDNHVFFQNGGMFDGSRQAALGIVGPDYGLWTFIKELGLRLIKQQYPIRRRFRCLP